MAEYIEREAARTLIKNFGKGAISDDRRELDAVDDIILLASAVECLPAADVAPVVHGRWEKYFHSYFGRHQCVCSECKDDDYWKKYFCYGNEHYCPHCGAKMDGEER